MAAMGGRRAWDDTRYLTWCFFGRRLHVWDKNTGDVRIEYEDRESKNPVIILVNINSKEGRAWQAGVEVTAPEARAALLTRGYEMWVNDSYWLFMPYKLKDSGVTLRDGGTRFLPDGRAADLLTLTFRAVGVTPQNKYDVLIARDTGLVEQWSFYENAADPAPQFTTPWGNWQRYGRILLSDDRGEVQGQRRRHTGLGTFDRLPRRVFESPDPVDEVLAHRAGAP